MNVTVEVVGEGEQELAVGAEATYADLIREAGYHPQEASVLVGGSPVPEDGVVDTDRVKLLRLIKGGDGSAASDGPTSGDTADDESTADESTVEEPADDGSTTDESATGESTPDESTADDSTPGEPESDAGEGLDLDFTLPNVGTGADPFALSGCDADLALVLIHRHYLCGNCRGQVKDVTAQYGEFVDRDTEVVSVVPTSEDKAAEWADTHDVPYPLLSDPEKSVGSQYGQPVKFGFLGRRFELLGRMPQVALLDLRREPELLWESVGRHPADRPDVEDLVDEIDKFR